jgi:membrane protease YdiL (CAAX protease family)
VSNPQTGPPAPPRRRPEPGPPPRRSEAAFAVAGTAAAGALLSLLRARSDSLAAPVLVHLAANCAAPLASALARTLDRQPVAAPTRP